MEDNYLKAKVDELEKRLEIVERKLVLHDDYIKTDIKSGIKEKGRFSELQDEINFIDEKLEHRKG